MEDVCITEAGRYAFCSGDQDVVEKRLIPTACQITTFVNSSSDSTTGKNAKETTVHHLANGASLQSNACIPTPRHCTIVRIFWKHDTALDFIYLSL
jgi:hypothetical protein